MKWKFKRILKGEYTVEELELRIMIKEINNGGFDKLWFEELGESEDFLCLC